MIGCSVDMTMVLSFRSERLTPKSLSECRVKSPSNGCATTALSSQADSQSFERLNGFSILYTPELLMPLRFAGLRYSALHCLFYAALISAAGSIAEPLLGTHSR